MYCAPIRAFFKIPAYVALTAVSPAAAIVCLPVTIPLFCLGIASLKKVMDIGLEPEDDEDDLAETFPIGILIAGFIAPCILAPVVPITGSYELLKESINNFRSALCQSKRTVLPVSP
ncbi:MAG: hypothetical protein ABII13_04660 [Patescibacteria group bacterium]